MFDVVCKGQLWVQLHNEVGNWLKGGCLDRRRRFVVMGDYWT